MSGSPSKCELFPGIYGAFMQMFLLALTLSVLVCKNFVERSSGVNNRKCQEFFLDMLKQIMGAGILHVLNLRILIFHHSGAPLPACQKYFLEIVVDTTVGVLAQWAIFNLFWIGLKSCLNEGHLQGFRRGQYYIEGVLEVTNFYKQLALWCACTVLMKMTMLLFIHISSPLTVPLVKASLSSLEASPNLELFIVMVVVPTFMNTFQFWVQDNFLQASNSSAPNSANTFDPWFCLRPDNKLRDHLKPLLPLFSVCDTREGTKGKGKGKGPVAPDVPKGKGTKGKGKGAEQLRPQVPGPRPAEGLRTRRNLKLHWTSISCEEHGDTIWAKVRNEMQNGSLPGLDEELLEQAFMEHKPTGGRGRNGASRNSGTHEPSDGAQKWRRSVKLHLIQDVKAGFHMELAYNQLEQKNPQELEGALGRREESSRSWAELPNQESLEAILKFLEMAITHESVLTIDAVSETPSEQFVLKLVADCGNINTMKGRVEAILAKGRLKDTLHVLQLEFDRIRDNVEHITKTSTKLPEILQYVLQLGNYVNHGSPQLGNAEAVELNSIVTAFGTAKCRVDSKEMTVFKFLARTLRKKQSNAWLEQLKQDLKFCCEARHVDPKEFCRQLQLCKNDLQKVNEQLAKSEGSQEPPALKPEELQRFIAEAQKKIGDLDADKLEKDRKNLIQYLALTDSETSIPAVLECFAAIHDELFGTQMHDTNKLKVGSKFVKVDDLKLNVQDWLKENQFAGVNRARIFFNPLATWVYPLHVAVMHKSPKVVNMLLDANADPTKTSLTASARELTPLRLARYYESSFNFTSRTQKGAYEEVIKVLEKAEGETGSWHEE